MNSSKVLMGILIGVVGGALLGILFSPDKGSKIRSNIAFQRSDSLEELKDKLDDLINGISKSSTNAWHEAEKIVMDGKIK